MARPRFLLMVVLHRPVRIIEELMVLQDNLGRMDNLLRFLKPFTTLVSLMYSASSEYLERDRRDTPSVSALAARTETPHSHPRELWS
ncbi:MAG: hypothetical protein H0X04_03055 [Chthoniobacterales bacterium]|nr:hypothetical protein [Chthoniobacterales bacterium]